MKLFIAICVISLGTVAQAQLYKYVDPATGAVEYVNQPKKGAIRIDSGDTLSPQAKRAADAKDKKQQAALTALAKEHPSACRKFKDRWSCEPRVGVNILNHFQALQMYPHGFTDDAVNGKLDIWRGVCTARARNGVIVSVTC
jgi:Domain of unknown function (DUF4124)